MEDRLDTQSSLFLVFPTFASLQKPQLHKTGVILVLILGCSTCSQQPCGLYLKMAAAENKLALELNFTFEFGGNLRVISPSPSVRVHGSPVLHLYVAAAENKLALELKFKSLEGNITKP